MATDTQIAALQKARAARRRRSIKDPLEKALADPRSYVKAVRAKCWDCLGRPGSRTRDREILACEADHCPLWHLRCRIVQSAAKREACRMASETTSGYDPAEMSE